jgi:hypothetical protein
MDATGWLLGVWLKFLNCGGDTGLLRMTGGCGGSCGGGLDMIEAVAGMMYDLDVGMMIDDDWVEIFRDVAVLLFND